MKKLMALFLVVVFACVSTVGCGDTKPTSKPAGGGGAGAGAGADKDKKTTP